MGFMIMRHWLPILTLAAVALSSTGCGLTCKEVASQMEEAKQAELAETTDDDEQTDPDPQLAIGLRLETLESVASDVAASSIKSLLSASKQLDVAGKKPVSVEALPEIKSFALDRREDACPHCFRVSAELSGDVRVDIPVLGKRTVPMNGNLQFVAPITLGPGDEAGTTAIQLDLAEAARENAPIVAIELGNLRNSWKSTIESLLATRLADTLLEELKPVSLATFKTPDFGIPSLGIQPVGLRITPDGSIVQGLIATDIALPDPPGAETLAEAARPADDRNLAIALPVGLVPAGVAHGFRTGDVSRTYTSGGDADDDGPFHVTVREFTVASQSPDEETDDSSDKLQTYGFGFRAWRLSDTGPCYWLEGRASGGIRAAGSSVEVSIDDVSFTESSATDFTVSAANWLSAQFLESGAQIVGASLDGKNLALPGGVYGVGNVALDVSNGFLTLSAVAKEQQEGAEASEIAP